MSGIDPYIRVSYIPAIRGARRRLLYRSSYQWQCAALGVGRSYVRFIEIDSERRWVG